MPPIRKAVFPVGGLGTRFLPATKAMPKEMLPVVDTPLIEYAVEEAKAAGVEEFIFVTGRGKTPIQDHFDRNVELELALQEKGKQELFDAVTRSVLEPGQIAFVRQTEPLGLGHAVWCARHLVGNDPFAVLLADDLIHGDGAGLSELVAVYEERGGNVIALMDVPREDTSKYGIVTPGGDDGHVVEVEDLVEKPDPAAAPSTSAIVGRYVLQPQVMDILAFGDRGAGGEIQLTDAMRKLVGEHPFHGVRLRGRRFDCGTKLGFLVANVAIALDRPDLGEALRAELHAVID